MTPSSPGFNPPKFSFNKKKFSGSISIAEPPVEADAFEEYPDDLFNSLIDDTVIGEEHSELTPIEEESSQQKRESFATPLEDDSHKNEKTTKPQERHHVSKQEVKQVMYAQPPDPPTIQATQPLLQQQQQPDLHEPKPVLALNGNRLIVQLSAFAASLETFKFSLQQRQNALDLAILGMDEKLGK